MKGRTEMSSLLKGFIAMIKNQLGKGVKIVRSNKKSKFTYGPMLQFYAKME